MQTAVGSRLRKPTDDEWLDCARLLYASGSELYTYFFIEREPKIYDLLHLFYSKPGMYSKDNITVEEQEGTIRGLILAYPARDMKQMGKKMLGCIKEMFVLAGPLNFSRMLLRFRLNAYFPGTHDDELFISNLAVLEEHRRKGIATSLLKKAEVIAVEKGLKKLSIYVEIENGPARTLYEKSGFHETRRAVLPGRYNRHSLSMKRYGRTLPLCPETRFISARLT